MLEIYKYNKYNKSFIDATNRINNTTVRERFLLNNASGLTSICTVYIWGHAQVISALIILMWVRRIDRSIINASDKDMSDASI
jgi:hypothetical protein